MMRNLLVNFRWRDALDVALVLLIVYRLLVAFRGTRAAQILVGLGGLLAAALVARRLELATISWLLDTFLASWAVLLVVLFQTELRRALARLGQGRFLQAIMGSSRAERTELVDEIITAAATLAARRIGALIVIERTGGLRQYAELGVPLDAVASADLLESLFLPNSPLHDGAVLVEGTRIAAAGCFLPLSRTPDIARPLGSRHRAALGISEETDGIALVVSEETGRTSLAVDGRIESPIDEAALRRRLYELVAEESLPTPRAAFWTGLRARFAPSSRS
ncbi:MAG TPA: diadenylate cyclase CdaA [Candidatus Acidoferrum sp.]|nr:diadenylate cyclase CdaA [Candidatus Acidoferrum sp.]